MRSLRVACRIRKATRAKAHVSASAPAPTHTHGSTRMHSRTRACTRAGICNTYCFFTAIMVSLTLFNVNVICTLPFS